MIRRCRNWSASTPVRVGSAAGARVAESTMRQALLSKDNLADVINVALEALSEQSLCL